MESYVAIFLSVNAVLRDTIGDVDLGPAVLTGLQFGEILSCKHVKGSSK